MNAIKETDKHHRGAFFASVTFAIGEGWIFLLVLCVRFNLEIVFKYFFS